MCIVRKSPNVVVSFRRLECDRGFSSLYFGLSLLSVLFRNGDFTGLVLLLGRPEEHGGGGAPFSLSRSKSSSPNLGGLEFAKNSSPFDASCQGSCNGSSLPFRSEGRGRVWFDFRGEWDWGCLLVCRGAFAREVVQT